MASTSSVIWPSFDAFNDNPGYSHASGTSAAEKEWQILQDEMKQVDLFDGVTMTNFRPAYTRMREAGEKVRSYVLKYYPTLAPDADFDKYQHFAGSYMLAHQTSPAVSAIIGIGFEVVYALVATVSGTKSHMSWADIEADFAGAMGLTPAEAISGGFLNSEIFDAMVPTDPVPPSDYQKHARKITNKLIAESQPQADDIQADGWIQDILILHSKFAGYIVPGLYETSTGVGSWYAWLDMTGPSTLLNITALPRQAGIGGQWNLGSQDWESIQDGETKSTSSSGPDGSSTGTVTSSGGILSYNLTCTFGSQDIYITGTNDANGFPDNKLYSTTGGTIELEDTGSALASQFVQVSDVNP